MFRFSSSDNNNKFFESLMRYDKDYFLDIKEVQFNAGMIVKSIGNDRYSFADGLSTPFGVIDDVRNESQDSTIGHNGNALVHKFAGDYGLKEFITDEFSFNPDTNYKENDLIYAMKGKISLIRNGNPIGKLIRIMNHIGNPNSITDESYRSSFNPIHPTVEVNIFDL